MLLEEFDEGGILLTTYHVSGNDGKRRLDAVTSEQCPQRTSSIVQKLLEAFLPAGYPSSVTDDYLPCVVIKYLYRNLRNRGLQPHAKNQQDSLQAFSSSIAGLISTRAVLEGVGVGNADATPGAAMLLSILRESLSRFATILFAYRISTALEPECKRYRFAADIFNDAAKMLECLCPLLPEGVRVGVLSCSSVLLALCGVCADSSKASLSAHFACKGNLGELNAKDASQETVISLFGMLVGSVVVPYITSTSASWITLICLLTIHLITNYAAVRAVTMRSLNRQRANILFSELIETGKVLTPREVSQRERIFERDAALRWRQGPIIGYCQMRNMEGLMRQIAQRRKTTGSFVDENARLERLLQVFQGEKYLLWYNHDETIASIVFKEGVTTYEQLQAWSQALLLASEYHPKLEGHRSPCTNADEFEVLASTLKAIGELFDLKHAVLLEAGWDLDTASLETQTGTRLRLS